MAQKKKAGKKTAKTSSSSKKPQRKNIKKRLETVAKRQEKQKEEFIAKLEEMPSQTAIRKRLGISRNTYYRWRKADETFSNDCEEALAKGREYFCDLAESKVFQGISKGDPGMVKFFLKHNSKRYGGKYTYEFIIREQQLDIEHLEFLAERVHAWKKGYVKVKVPKEKDAKKDE